VPDASGVLRKVEETFSNWRLPLAKARMRKADGGALGDMAESLGRILGQAEAQWREQRGTLVKSLKAVRDKANALLAELGEVPLPRAATKATRAVASAVVKATAPARKAGRRTFTAAQKAETSRRMKAYWAARRKEKAK
jgi:hypothetical protein